jgi:hypothetical protein
MKSIWSGITIRSAAPVACAFLLTLPLTFAQEPAGPSEGWPEARQAAPALSPDQLSNLLAPIALYPDPLLSQVLSASTYPLEIVEAQQWLARNRNLKGRELVEAAREQNWDASVQALVVFPDTLEFLAKDIRWTTDLGNAFLAQQDDVMNAVQALRARARANGRLVTTPQQVVTMESQDGRDAIAIQPADPQVIYVPVYNPVYVWGPPVYGVYPSLWYPPGFGLTFGFGPAYYMSAYYPSWGGWGGWGWNCGWFGGGLYVNVGFFHRYGYRGGYVGPVVGRGYSGRTVWVHDPGHRGSIPYPNRSVATRFAAEPRHGGFSDGRGGGRQFNDARADAGRQSRPADGGNWRSFGDGNRGAARPEGRGFTGSTGGAQSGRSMQSEGGRWSTGAGASAAPRSNSGPREFSSGGGGGRSYSAPSPMRSAPRASGGGGFPAGRSGGAGAPAARSGGGGGGGGHRR